MQLRSGNVLPAFPDWPTLKRARSLSIKTDDVKTFEKFCWDSYYSASDPSCSVYQRRLIYLSILETFFQCSSEIVSRFQPVIQVLYVKLCTNIPCESVKTFNLAKYKVNVRKLITGRVDILALQKEAGYFF